MPSSEIDSVKVITIYWKPLTPTYAMAAHIGLSILIKLDQTLDIARKVSILVKARVP